MTTYTTAQIARHFGINPRTVRKHYGTIKQAYPDTPETFWKQGTDRYTQMFKDEVEDLRNSPLTTAQWIEEKKLESSTAKNISPSQVNAIVENMFDGVVPTTPMPVNRSNAQSRLARLQQQNQAIETQIVEAMEINTDRDETDEMLIAIAIEAGKADGLKAFQAYREARRQTFEKLRAQLED